MCSLLGTCNCIAHSVSSQNRSLTKHISAQLGQRLGRLTETCSQTGCMSTPEVAMIRSKILLLTGLGTWKTPKSSPYREIMPPGAAHRRYFSAASHGVFLIPCPVVP